MSGRENISPSYKLTQASQVLGAAVDHEMEEASGEPKCGDPVSADGRSQLVQGRGSRRHDGQPSSVEQWAPDLECGGIKGDRSQEKKGLIGSEVAIALCSGRGEQSPGEGS